MNEEKCITFLSGINNLRGLALGRFILGIVFLIYGVIFYDLSKIGEFWTKLSLCIALWGLGLMFILDGQNILREYVKFSRITQPKT